MPGAKNGERPYPGSPKSQFPGPAVWAIFSFSAYRLDDYSF